MVPPPLAVQLTAELKLPVPDTVAVHWLVEPDAIEVGLQLAPTVVMVAVVLLLLLLPPQAASNIRQHAPTRVPRNRTLSPLLLDLCNIHALWDHRRNIRAAMETACVSTHLEDET
jgi:hypothetical protein